LHKVHYCNSNVVRYDAVLHLHAAGGGGGGVMFICRNFGWYCGKGCI